MQKQTSQDSFCASAKLYPVGEYVDAQNDCGFSFDQDDRIEPYEALRAIV